MTWLTTLLALYHRWLTRRHQRSLRKQVLPAPKPDERDSVGQFKRMNR